MCRRSGISLLFLGILTVVLQSEAFSAGSLKVTSESGIKVYVDSIYRGMTTDNEYGLYVRDLKAGKHKYKLERDGYLPHRGEVDIKDAKTVEVDATLIKLPLIRNAEESEQCKTTKNSGALEIRSIPKKCQILFLGINIEKTGPKVIVEDLPEGEFPIYFGREGEVLEHKVKISKGEVVRLEANFADRKVGRIMEGSQDSVDDVKKNYETGIKLLADKQYREAIKRFGRVISAVPDFVDARVMMGQCYAELEQYDEAIGEYGLAFSKDRKNADAKNGLVECYKKKGLKYYEKGDADKAAKEWEKGLLIDSQNQGLRELIRKVR